MRILIDIGHPAHVHYFRNLAKELQLKGHTVIWTVKDIVVAKKLLEYYGFEYILFPKKSDNIIGKILKQIYYNFKMYKLCIKENIDIALGTSVSIAHVSKFTNVKSIIFDDDDDDVQPIVTKFVNPFANYLVSPDVLKGKRKMLNSIFYPGYHELAYLHPKYFTPDNEVLKELGLNQKSIYFILRFNSFNAHHDIGEIGLSISQKIKLIEILKKHGKIFITTEKEIEPELKKYQLKINPEKIHSLIANAKMFIGDSQTMTSEAAVLGVPSLRCNSFAGRISYINEQEIKYGLTFGFHPNNFDKMLDKLNKLLLTNNLRAEFKRKRNLMLDEKINVTSFWLWLIENIHTKKFNLKDLNKLFWLKFK